MYYNESSGSKYVQCVILIDLENQALQIQYRLGRRSDLTTIFVFGQCSTGNNWPKGHYKEGAEIMDSVLDSQERNSKL